MIPITTASLRDRVWDDLAKRASGKSKGWGVYTVDRSGNVKFSTGHAHSLPIPGMLVEYWVSPDETDWRVILNGLIHDCEASGRIQLI